MLERLARKGWTVYQIAAHTGLPVLEVRERLGLADAGGKQAVWRPMEKPACVSDDLWIAWREAEVSERRPIDFCRDCTPSYQRACAMQGRCNHPEVIFKWVVVLDETCNYSGVEEMRGVLPGNRITVRNAPVKLEEWNSNGWRVSD